MPNTLKAIYDDMRARFTAAGVGTPIDTPDLDARLILEQRVNLSLSDIIARPHHILSASQISQIEQDTQDRLSGKPVSRIFGEREFWGRPFKITEETLDPRPDSETFIEAVIDICGDTPPRQILDLGTGSGCLLITLLAEYKDAQGIGIDLSPDAVRTSKENAQALGVADRAQFLQGSWYEPLAATPNRPESFDLIISNPPYITNQIIPTLSEEVQKYDPILALDGGDDGLQAYRDIFIQLKNHISKGAKIFLEIGFDQKDSVSRLSNESGFFVARAFSDLGGRDRVLHLVEKIVDGDK